MAHGSHQPSGAPHSSRGTAGVALHHRGLFYTIRPGTSAAPDTGAAHPQAPLQHNQQPRSRQAPFSGRGNAAPPQRCAKARGCSRVQQAARHLTPARGREPLPAVRANGRSGKERVLAAAPGRAELLGLTCLLPGTGRCGDAGAPCGLWGRGRADTRIACTRGCAGSPEANGRRPLR